MTAVETKQPVRGRWTRWTSRVLLAGIMILGIAAITGATYEFVSGRRDARRFPQEGRSVNVGGFRLNIHCTGEGSPAVILDSGLGIPAMGWDLVQPDVEKFTRVCSYDRAGYGWSDPGPLPRTSQQIAKELHTLLQNAGVPPPYIMVGHSFGGFNVRVYNGLYANEVAGMVLVDSSQEDENPPLPASMTADERKEQAETLLLARLYPALFHLGVARWYLARDPTPLPEHLDSGLRYLILRPKHFRAMVDEGLSFDGDSREQVRESGNLGDKPLIVLTAGVSRPGHADLQRRLCRLSTHGQQIIVEKSAHLIPFEQPTTVTNAIRSVFDSIIAAHR
jgi:pimeloyl-ACP methyl ester carboxylesterase